MHYELSRHDENCGGPYPSAGFTRQQGLPASSLYSSAAAVRGGGRVGEHATAVTGVAGVVRGDEGPFPAALGQRPALFCLEGVVRRPSWARSPGGSCTSIHHEFSARLRNMTGARPVEHRVAEQRAQ